MIIGLYILNHLIVTLIRVYLRTLKLKNYKEGSDKKKILIKGFERRVLRLLTFFYSAILTLGEYLVLEYVF